MEKRKRTRYPVQNITAAYLPGVFNVLERFRTNTFQIQDLSLTGLQILSSRRFKADRELIISLFLPEVIRPIRVHGLVRWCEATPHAKAKGTHYSIGVQISDFEEDGKIRLQRIMNDVVASQIPKMAAGLKKKIPR